MNSDQYWLGDQHKEDDDKVYYSETKMLSLLVKHIPVAITSIRAAPCARRLLRKSKHS